MRKIYPNNELPHLWIHNKQKEAYNSSRNISFDEDLYYSYNLILASKLDSSNIVFVFNGKMSRTTTKHYYNLLQAVSHKKLIYCMNPFYAINGTHNKNFEDFESKLKDCLLDIDRKVHKETYINLFMGYYKNVLEYASVCNTTVPDDIIALYNSVKYDFDNLLIKSKNERIKRIKEEKEIEEKAIKYWRSNSDYYLHTYIGNNVYLKKLDNSIITSKGVKIPMNVAIYIKNKLANNEYKVGDVLHSLIDFKIDELTTKYIRLGCHKITFKEIWDIEVVD